MTNKKWLPHTIGVLSLAILMIACASAPSRPTTINPYRPSAGIPHAGVLGTVEARFTSRFAQGATQPVNAGAYTALIAAARREFPGANIDVADITWNFTQRTTRPTTTFHYSATGTVLLLGGGGAILGGVAFERALGRVTEDIKRHFTAGARIAIVYVSAEDAGIEDFLASELELILWRQGFVMVDRFTLDSIRAEQRLGMSGEVDDSTAARIGHFAGASIVLTGRVDGEGALRRLRLRALDPTTAQVLGVAAERV